MLLLQLGEDRGAGRRIFFQSFLPTVGFTSFRKSVLRYGYNRNFLRLTDPTTRCIRSTAESLVLCAFDRTARLLSTITASNIRHPLVTTPTHHFIVE